MKIVFTGGGTAGHVTPNIALIEKLSDGNCCYYIGTDGMEKQLIEPLTESGKLKSYFQITAGKLQRKFTLKNLTLPFKLLSAVRQAKRILAEIKPDAVFSKGGYVALPVVIAAHKLKIPSVVHENDITMGLANKISSHYCDRLISTFPCDKKAQVVGALVRNGIKNGDRQKGLETCGFDGKKPVLLVMGGSLGALELNNVIADCRSLAEKFDIFVISGKGKAFRCDFVNQRQFVDNIGDIYACCDVAVTRGGSNSLVELTCALVPFVTIPLSKCSRGEQLKNAHYFCKNNCGTIIEGTVTPKSLISAVNAVYANKNAYRQSQRKLQIDGTEKIAEILLSYGKPPQDEKSDNVRK
ncbi:MAG: UDP-N-acetylglucosamine--N-acetylmuramyl-(pentapeptide) pyrophosphoryl-undecaprenol N-acetylglucosamine transferase [Corallococcus sp.]|nr:UDP-N-acetylglucosamine--N-acetylmuramyl-(pentapeptide) pyrophosphoryl-undecaprenol N-acetylglucosamine transferase [Corallococcus sp.]